MAVNIVTQERLKELLQYSADTGIFTWSRSTNRRISVGQRAGCVRPDGYVTIKAEGVIYLAHRLAWFFTYDEMPSMDIDHMNGDPSDNRIANLRMVTDFENMQNLHRPMESNKTSRLLGVSFNSASKRWVAQIRANGISRHLGMFGTPEEAHRVYCAAKRELHPTSMYGKY